MIKTIIFDLGGVYYSSGTKDSIKFFSKKFGISEYKAAKVLKYDFGAKYRTGELTKSEFWKKVINYLKINVTPEYLNKLWLNSYMKLNESVEKIVLELKDKGYELFYLSDNFKERDELTEKKFHYKKNFKTGILSYKVGIKKPNIEIYKLLLKKTKSKPSECVFIDNLIVNLKPAKILGIHTILFKNGEQLKNRLKDLNVKI